MRERWELAPPAARARGDQGNWRLHARWIDFNLRRKRPVIANVAIARELAGLVLVARRPRHGHGLTGRSSRFVARPDGQQRVERPAI